MSCVIVSGITIIAPFLIGGLAGIGTCAVLRARGHQPKALVSFRQGGVVNAAA